ncbi:MAG TPA: hypothetical protein VFX40_05325, partial [Gemmatimonadaceae bacterium]|nr:hypothetical protein [Gemmatimonadaceae bacterium]
MKRLRAGVIAALLLAACDRGGSDDLQTVRIAARRHPSAAPIFIADEAGFFREQGIRLEFIDAPMRSTQAIPLLEN